MMSDKEKNTKRILGLMENPYDNVKWTRDITELDKLLLAMLYNAPAILSVDFLAIAELLANKNTVRKSLAKLEKRGFIAYQTIYRENYITIGRDLIRELDSTVKKAILPYVGKTFLDRYAIKGYILRYSISKYIRNKGKAIWDTMSEKEQDRWITNTYIENVVFRRLFDMSEKERAAYLFTLPILSPDEKKSLQTIKSFTTVYKEKFINAVFKSWKGNPPDELDVFKNNFRDAISNDPIITARIWTRSLVDGKQVFEWMKNATVNGTITGFTNHNQAVYRGFAKVLKDKESIIKEMMNYDSLLKANRYLALQETAAITNTITGKSTEDKLDKTKELKGQTKEKITYFKQHSHIAYVQDARNTIGLTYQTLDNNDILISSLSKTSDTIRLHSYLVDGGLNELSAAAYRKKLKIMDSFSALLDIPFTLQIVSMSKVRAREIEKRLDTTLQTINMGRYDITTGTTTNANRHNFIFSYYQKPIPKTEMIMSLVSTSYTAE